MAGEQYPVEVIMARGLMSNMATAAFLVDNVGTLIFFNEVAGELLGVRFEDAGPMAAEEWGSRFTPMALDGRPLPLEELPLAIAISQGRPAHGPMRIVPARGEERAIEVCAFPIAGRDGQSASMAIFWDRSDPCS
jgi:PAS domain-containing protein